MSTSATETVAHLRGRGEGDGGAAEDDRHPGIEADDAAADGADLADDSRPGARKLVACLNTYNPPGGWRRDLVRFLLTNHEGAVDTLIACDGFRRLLPAPNALANCKTRVRTGYDLKMMGGSNSDWTCSSTRSSR